VKTQSVCGNFGPRIRSDCEISIRLADSGGIQIDLESKVERLHGISIRNLIHDGLNTFGIPDAQIMIRDSGALPFVISARLEAAVRLLKDDTTEFLPEMINQTGPSSSRDQFRFSRLYLPGNTPSMMLNAGIHKPNGIILDLEDSVAPQKKHEARYLVRNALRQIDFMGAERMVRINQLPDGIEDVKCIVPHFVDLILLPKCEHPEQVQIIEKELHRLSEGHTTNLPWIMPIIESALGIENAFEIARASKYIVAMAVGLEDYTADIGVQRTLSGHESHYARTRLVNACKAAGIQPIDSVFSDVSDQDGLTSSVMESKALGFEGVGCIHPRQIPVIHEAFQPSSAEIEKAQKVVYAYEKANKQGLGVVSLGTKMIDAPVVKRAQQTINLALQLQLIRSDWMDQMPNE